MTSKQTKTNYNEINPLKDPDVTYITNKNENNFQEEKIKYSDDYKSPKKSFNDPKDDITIQIDQREEELSKREKIVNDREKAVELKEKNLHTLDIAETSKKNWPFKSFPMDRHDIENDIPFDNQRLCKRAYHTWLLTCSGLSLNVITLLCVMFLTNGVISSPMERVLWSIIYMCLGVVISWTTWYKGLYNSLRHVGTFSWVIFWGGFGLHALFVIYSLVGLPNWATSGAFNLLAQLGPGGSWLVIFLCVINISLWAFILMLTLVIGRSALDVFRYRGAGEELKNQAKSTIVAEITGAI